MAEQGSYPLNGRALGPTDTCTGVVTGQTADITLSVLASLFWRIPRHLAQRLSVLILLLLDSLILIQPWDSWCGVLKFSQLSG